MMNIKKILTAALAMGFAFLPAAAQTKSTSPHSAAHKNLLAKQSTAKDQIKLTEHNTFLDLIDDIEPEPDIYTEGWNSKSVNPFKAADVPNTALIDVTGYAMPCKTADRVTSNYGYRARFGRMHKGIDLHIRNNDTIYAAFDGKVRLTAYEGKGYGNYVIIRHPNDLETVYGHLNKALVKPEQVVKAGDPIALGGSTGRSTGPHLHFETRYMGYAINPAAIFDFPNLTTHTDTYAFDKSSYTQGRNYDPRRVTSSTKGSRKSKKSKASASSGKGSSHEVKKGETLSSIAKRNGTTVAALTKLNGISKNSTLRPGQKLKVK